MRSLNGAVEVIAVLKYETPGRLRSVERHFEEEPERRHRCVQAGRCDAAGGHRASSAPRHGRACCASSHQKWESSSTTGNNYGYSKRPVANLGNRPSFGAANHVVGWAARPV